MPGPCRRRCRAARPSRLPWLPLLASVLAATAVAAPAAPGAAALPAFLAGCWQADGGPPGSGEQWMAPAGGLMPGMARSLRADGTARHEFLLVRADAQAGLVLEAMPSGQAPARFALASLAEREVVFANPGHDFPQRIGYRLEAGGRLTGWIEGAGEDGVRRIDFPMHAVACPRAGAAPAG